MSNDLTQTGFGGIALQDIGPKIQITQILGKSYEYNEMLDQLKTLEEFFAVTPEDNAEKRLQLSAKINAQKDRIEQFKKDVLQLAQAFQNIEIDANNVEVNTDRLQRAKTYFENGEFGEARAVLETELEQMQDEQTRLLKEKERYEQDILPKLSNNSEEFYILALSTQSNYANPHRFADTCRYFELSIASEASKANLFKYAYFLKENAQFPKAINYYNQYLNKFANELSPEKKATTLNNLAVLHWNQNEYDKASEGFTEALEIYQNLAKDNPQAYLPDVAMTLNNLAILHQNQNEYEKASEEFTEALEIHRNLAKDNPQAYLSKVATTLNNLAGLHWNQNEYEKASEEYTEALEIYRNLYEQIPNAYAPYLANTLKNIAAFYQESLPEREKSLAYVAEAVILLRPIVETVPFTQRYLQNAMNILRDWNLSDEEIERLIEEKMKEM